MEKELKEIIEKSKKAVDESGEKIEELSEDFGEEAGKFWADLKKSFADVSAKLSDAYDDLDLEDKVDDLKANLNVIEARDKLDKIKVAAEEFAQKASEKGQEGLDVAALKAHLAKMESEDLWEEKQKELTHQYHVSKTDVQKLAQRSGEEIKEIFDKLAAKV
ncbi:MAG: hypothetical protein U9Q90_11380 [Campylobacterota bacterium]|nr:hypothetical protein [Campylobacterota bacterium]